MTETSSLSPQTRRYRRSEQVTEAPRTRTIAQERTSQALLQCHTATVGRLARLLFLIGGEAKAHDSAGELGIRQLGVVATSFVEPCRIKRLRR